MIETAIARRRARKWLSLVERNSKSGDRKTTDLVTMRRHRITIVENMIDDAEAGRDHLEDSGAKSKQIEIHSERWWVPSSWPKLCLKRKKFNGWELYSNVNPVSGEKARIYLLADGSFATDIDFRQQRWISHAHPTRKFSPWLAVKYDAPDSHWRAVAAAAKQLECYAQS